jgi:hypothetical protein
VDLLQRSSPIATPLALVAPSETLDKVGLTRPAAVTLATKCLWLDNKAFEVTQFATASTLMPIAVVPAQTQPVSVPPPLELQPGTIERHSLDTPSSRGDPTAGGLY